jgi:ArsR family transcriptional regulator, lead/cadmium/zinc/bismuth-responsive transcriptional repressor
MSLLLSGTEHSIIRWTNGVTMSKEPSVTKPHRHAPHSWPKLPGAANLELASAMFRALGDPGRLRLLARLAGREICVSELAELEKEKLTTVSARLQTLHEVRLVKRRRAAKHIYYGLWDSHVLRLVQSAMKHAAEKQ